MASSSATTFVGSLTVAALKKYGLLDYEGSGDARTASLTDLAVDILMKPDPLPGIQRAALTPPIYREMWDTYHHDIPPEEALRYEFVVQRGFTENGFRDFLRIYRDTISFAKFDPSQPAEPTVEDEAQSEPESKDSEDLRTSTKSKTQPPPVDPTITAYAIPVAPGLNVTVEGRFPLSPTAWAQFMAVLAAMRPALVEGEPTDTGLD
jgi:hypothetical protein